MLLTCWSRGYIKHQEHQTVHRLRETSVLVALARIPWLRVLCPSTNTDFAFHRVASWVSRECAQGSAQHLPKECSEVNDMRVCAPPNSPQPSVPAGGAADHAAAASAFDCWSEKAAGGQRQLVQHDDIIKIGSCAPHLASLDMGYSMATTDVPCLEAASQFEAPVCGVSAAATVFTGVIAHMTWLHSWQLVILP